MILSMQTNFGSGETKVSSVTFGSSVSERPYQFIAVGVNR